MASLPKRSGAFASWAGAIVALLGLLAACHSPNIPDNLLAGRSGFVMYVASSNSPPEDTVALASLLNEAGRFLPEKLKQTIDRPIAFAIDSASPQEDIHVPICDPTTNQLVDKPAPQTLGRSIIARRASDPHLILLHPGIIAIAHAGREASPHFSCGHKSLFDLAVSTVIHEVAHIYDAAAGLSREPVFQHLQQFAPQDARRKIKAHNQLRIRTPDIYEFSDLQENLAVNFEYFMMDPEFKCRRPAVYAYLSAKLDTQPFASFACQVNTLVYAGNQPAYLDPSRVYQIHYLFAARGKGIASRWGHSMFRIVMCSPKRTQIDARCLEDLHDHLVLSFVANLRDDMTINSLKGLTGKYVAQLMIRPLTEVLNDYAEVDYRDLQSIPLSMSAAQMRQFIEHALELYWSYSGRYYFLTNNCADESLRLIQSALPADAVQQLSILTPLGLRDELIRVDAADDSVLADRKSALARGYLFPSALERYEELYATFRDQLPKAAPRRLRSYLYATKPADRLAWAGAQHGAALSGLFALEGVILQRLLKDIERRIVIRIMFRKDPRYTALGQKLKSYLLSLRQPWELVQGGYGIPLPQEFAIAPRSVRPGFPEEIIQKAMELIKIDYPQLAAEYFATGENRRNILALILKSAPSASSNQLQSETSAAGPGRN